MTVAICTDPDFFLLLTGSYARLVGRPLVTAERGPAWLYHDAPFAVVAHNTEADPRFIYANRTAQACFEYSWDEFTTLRSRFSAEMPDRYSRRIAAMQYIVAWLVVTADILRT
jgi:hypothetical protein